MWCSFGGCQWSCSMMTTVPSVYHQQSLVSSKSASLSFESVTYICRVIITDPDSRHSYNSVCGQHSDIKASPQLHCHLVNITGSKYPDLTTTSLTFSHCHQCVEFMAINMALPHCQQHSDIIILTLPQICQQHFCFVHNVLTPWSASWRRRITTSFISCCIFAPSLVPMQWLGFYYRHDFATFVHSDFKTSLQHCQWCVNNANSILALRHHQ